MSGEENRAPIEIGMVDGQETHIEKPENKKAFEKFRMLYGQFIDSTPKPNSLSGVDIKLYGDKEGVEQTQLSISDQYSYNPNVEITQKYKQFDPDLTVLWGNRTASQIRHGIGEGFGLNFGSAFLSNPDDLDQDMVHEPWYDLFATLGYIRKVDTSKLSDSQKERIAHLKDKIEEQIFVFLEQIQANPDALAYGMKNVSPENVTKLWEIIKQKYSESIGSGTLEQVITVNTKTAIAEEAWQILKTRSDFDVIVLKRLVDNSNLPNTIRKEAAQIMLAKLKELEERELEGDKQAADELKFYGYHTQMYDSFVGRLKTTAEL